MLFHEMVPFTIETLPVGNERHIVVAGELTLESAPRLREALAAPPHGRRTVLELGGVTFVDSTGLGAIVRGYLALREAGHAVSVSQPLGSAVENALRLAGLLHVFPVESGD